MPTIPPMYFPSVPFPINFSFDANIAYILLFTMSSQLNELRINIPTKLDGVNATLISANERHVIAVNLYRDQERLERRQGTENISISIAAASLALLLATLGDDSVPVKSGNFLTVITYLSFLFNAISTFFPTFSSHDYDDRSIIFVGWFYIGIMLFMTQALCYIHAREKYDVFLPVSILASSMFAVRLMMHLRTLNHKRPRSKEDKA